jgi:hypothetical protein
MIRHDITAGLFAPVELFVTEHENRKGTDLVYVKPSTKTKPCGKLRNRWIPNFPRS